MAKRKCEQVSIELKYNSIIQIENKIKKKLKLQPNLALGQVLQVAGLNKKIKFLKNTTVVLTPTKN